LFSATVNAATRPNTDPTLVSQLRTALGQIEPYARTDSGGASSLIANRTAIGPWEEFDLVHD
jgi:hypothetical protein